MREVIKYNKNHLTGEVVQEAVYKKPQLMRNTARVELRDAVTGELVEEAYTENAVTEKYEARAYQTIYGSLLMSTEGKGIANRSQVDGRMSHMFSNILLTDSDTPDLEDEYFVHGRLVAAAKVAGVASSSSSRAGTFNASESFSEITDDYLIHVHRVYDWATNSGNGTIRSIYWPFADISVNDAIDASTKYDFSYATCAASLLRSKTSDSQTFPYGSSTKSVSDIFFDRHGNTYLNDNGTYYKCLNQKKFLLAGQDPIFEASPSFFTHIETPGYYYNISITEGNSKMTSYYKIMTVTKYDYSGNVIDTWDVDCISDCPFLVNLRASAKLATSNNNDSWMGYSDNDGWVGIRLYFNSGSSSTRIFPSVNSDDVITIENYSSTASLYGFYNVITKQWLYTMDPSKYAPLNNNLLTAATFLRKVDGYNITAKNSYKLKFSNGNVEAIPIPYNTVSSGYGTTSSGYLRCYFDRMHSSMNVGVGIYGSSNLYNRIIKLMPIGAHTRLAEAIAKNSMTTMKIQYDFYFRIPADGVEPEDIWCGYDTE